MSVHFKAQMKMSQQLSMTADLQQSIKLLGLSHQELKEAIETEILENPLLEATETAETTETTEATETTETTETAEATEEGGEESYDEGDENRQALESWKESFNKASSKKTTLKPSDDSFESYISQPITLKEDLIWQAQMDSLSDKEKNILFLLISHLDERGYLPHSLEEISERDVFSLEELSQALVRLQSMEPLGVGARDLKECLLIQARHLNEDTRDMVSMIQKHLHHLEKKNYQPIVKDLNIPFEEVMHLVEILSSMNPFPAREFVEQPTVYVVPDVYIYKEKEGYKVLVNDEGFPDVQISSNYEKWLKNQKKMDAYVKEKMRAGQWFIRSLMKRKETIQKVTNSLVHHQKDFLDKGLEGLKPLILQDIASDVGLHPSTVSRVTSNKYAHTPLGLISMKRFFSTGVVNDLGKSIPVDFIKFKIKQWVAQESSLSPLSDEQIRRKIHEEFHLNLNRRTIALYRDSLKILPLTRRRQALSSV